MGLPTSAWPYGRVVVASDVGLRQAGFSDGPAINRNRHAAVEILAGLSVDVVWVPSALSRRKNTFPAKACLRVSIRFGVRCALCRTRQDHTELGAGLVV
jgi:hypothetical protein